MRYIDIGGQVIPKHCLYGPRPAEGLVFNDFEWWSITDHLIKSQREKELLSIQKAKEETKKNISFEMTRTWTNTLASIKTLGNQKRIEKIEKEKQYKINQYHEILKNRKEEREKYLADVRKVLYETKDAPKTINAMVLLSTVLKERQKQIDLKNHLKHEEEKKVKELAQKFKEDAIEFEKIKLKEKINEKVKKQNQKKDLDIQVLDLKLRKQAEAEEFEHSTQDLINMKIEEERIKTCNLNDKNYRKKFASRYKQKSESRLEFEKKLQLEQEEEDEINKIYITYNKKFEKGRKEKEEKILKERIDQRTKIADQLAENLKIGLKEEADRTEAARLEKDKLAMKEEEARAESKRQAAADILLSKKIAEESAMRQICEIKERKKWEMMQVYRSAEYDEEWRKYARRKLIEDKAATRAAYDEQCQQLKKKREEELQERLAPLEDEVADKEELLDHCQQVVEFTKEHNLPPYPVLKAVAQIKKEYNLENNLEKKTKDPKAPDMCSKKPRQGSFGNGCYCLKY